MCKLFNHFTSLFKRTACGVQRSHAANSNLEPHYFKYKSLSGDSFKYFVELLLNQKMYAATFNQLNDPMEGMFLSKEFLNRSIRDQLYYNKVSYRIISLVKNTLEENKPNNMLMWSHYADEHRGCCIEFHFANDEDNNNVHEIEYVDNNNILQREIDLQIILRKKFVDWKYEKETRFLKEMRDDKFVDIIIDKIYFGMRIDDMYNEADQVNHTFYKELVNRLCPGVQLVFMTAQDFLEQHSK